MNKRNQLAIVYGMPPDLGSALAHCFVDYAKKIAKENHAIFVPFQSMFDEAVKYAEAKHWAGDGVHPSPHGASLMAHFWIQAVTGA